MAEHVCEYVGPDDCCHICGADRPPEPGSPEAQLATAREALAYVVEHHADGHECLCNAARSVAEAGLRLTDGDVRA